MGAPEQEFLGEGAIGAVAHSARPVYLDMVVLLVGGREQGTGLSAGASSKSSVESTVLCLPVMLQAPVPGKSSGESARNDIDGGMQKRDRELFSW